MADGPTIGRRPAIGVPYQEASKYTWTGFYGGGGVGIFSGLTGLEGIDEGFIEALDAGNWGYIGDVRVGYDYQFPGGILVLGAFAGYTFGEASAVIGGIEASLTPTWNIGGRVGITTWNSSLLYVGYKYSEAEINFGGAESTVAGHTALVGFELPLAQALTIGAEYGYTKYDDVNLGGGVVAEPEAHTIMLRGNVRLGTWN